MKTTLKCMLSLMLVALMSAELNAQKAQFSLDAHFEPPLQEESNTIFSTELLKYEYQENYQNEDIRLTRRTGFRSRGFRNSFRGRSFKRSMRRDDGKFYTRRGTDNFVNVYIGLNNYLEDDELPSSNSLLSLNPITSYYAAVSFDNVSHLLGPIYLDWGAGVSISDFSFENTRTRLVKGDDEISLIEVTDISGRKSKLSASHINVHFVPTLSFGRYNSFRVGLGVYAGYRIGAHTKVKFDDANGDKQKDKIKDNFYVNPYRYGVRATVGWDSFDLFFNYDMTELFEEDIDAPRLNPVTFGVIL